MIFLMDFQDWIFRLEVCQSFDIEHLVEDIDWKYIFMNNNSFGNLWGYEYDWNKTVNFSHFF